jgi:hypothetical protein
MSLIAPYDESIFPSDLSKNPSQLTPTAFPFGIMNSGRTSLCATYQLSSAELKALQTTAILLAAAPGAGFALMPKAMISQYKFLTTAYTLGNADNIFQIEYVGKTTNLLSQPAVGLVDQVVSEIANANKAVVGGIIAQTNRENLGLEVKLTGTTPALTLGLGSLVISLDYEVLKLV